MAPPALPAIEQPLAPLLLLLSVLGALLALHAQRSGVASLRSAFLHASLPVAVWLLVASLNPRQPTQLVLTPFGAALGLAFLSGLVAARGAAGRAALRPELSWGCYLWSCAGALIGARLAYVAAHAGQFPGARGILALHAGGLAMNGALLGGVGVARWYFRAQPLRWRAWLDGLAPALGLALACGSLGAYLQGPTRTALLGSAAAGLVLSAAAFLCGRWQRFHGQAFVLVAIGYGIVQLSVDALSAVSARAAEGWVSILVNTLVDNVASWLVVAGAGAAGWVWHKSFTFRRI